MAVAALSSTPHRLDETGPNADSGRVSPNPGSIALVRSQSSRWESGSGHPCLELKCQSVVVLGTPRLEADVSAPRLWDGADRFKSELPTLTVI